MTFTGWYGAEIGSDVRGCDKLFDIHDRLMTSLVYCAIYARLLRTLGGASFCWTTLAFFAGGEGMLGVSDHILYILKVTVIYVIFICAVKRTYFLVEK